MEKSGAKNAEGVSGIEQKRSHELKNRPLQLMVGPFAGVVARAIQRSFR